MKYFTFPLSGMRKVAAILSDYVADPKRGLTDLANANRTVMEADTGARTALFGDNAITRCINRLSSGGADNLDKFTKWVGGNPRGPKVQSYMDVVNSIKSNSANARNFQSNYNNYLKGLSDTDFSSHFSQARDANAQYMDKAKKQGLPFTQMNPGLLSEAKRRGIL